MRVSEKEKNESIQQLKEWIHRGNTVYTILRHVSRSGMMRHISVVLIRDRGKTILHPNWHISRALGYPLTENERLKIGGCGMDMGFALVYDLSVTLFKNGYALRHRWL